MEYFHISMECLELEKLRLNFLQIVTCIYSLKKGTRGRIFYISNRYSKGNKYLKSYDSKQESKHYIKMCE